jgi:hypothetical protein
MVMREFTSNGFGGVGVGDNTKSGADSRREG